MFQLMTVRTRLRVFGLRPRRPYVGPLLDARRSARQMQVLNAHSIKDEKQVPALLSLIGGRTYNVLRDLTATDRPATKTFNELVAILKNHLSPKPLLIAERFRFHKRDQKEGESVRDYVAQLRKLSEHCEFGVVLMESLRDRFVCGLKNEAVQKKLLSEKDLSFDKAVDIAVAMETAARDAVELQAKHKGLSVHSLKSKNPKFSSRNQKSSQQNKPKVSSHEKPCYRCTRPGHDPQKCFFKNEKCNQCGKVGHIKKACRREVHTEKNGKKVHSLDDQYYEYGDIVSDIYTVHDTQSPGPYWVKPRVDGTPLRMELDTGSAVSVIRKQDLVEHFGKVTLNPTTKVFKTYSGETITPIGVKEVKVHINNQISDLPLYVVERGGPPPSFGRSWLSELKLNWAEIHAVSAVSDRSNRADSVKSILQRYAEVFEPNLGTVKNIQARFILKEDSQPKFMKARPVPFSLRPAVDKELDRLVNLGILTPVDHSSYATTIVVVPKKDGSDRICGDFKTTVNSMIVIDKYPLPKIEDIFANLSGVQHFTKIDLKNAYLQMEVVEEQRPLLTINTHRGLFRYNRLVFGIAAAPAIWQRTMEQILQGIPGVQCIIDDMIITGRTEEEHLQNLGSVLGRLQKYGLKANIEKCDIFKDKIEFCGHVINAGGLHKTQEKIKAVVEAAVPENVSQLRAFLGLVNYYGKFLHNLASTLRPLHKLLEKNAPWVWSREVSTGLCQGKGTDDIRAGLSSL
ncbi:uncharacterized protein K02A2.6-like [Ylistrum balloti]|uniref:uncharacterized protein K02A2.6-like n=1 Tax=Ylistrum balloti TaxID=509963 RepID=UPI002905BA1F|nr:uncharacterized protein K02A2.6-like [Ylistrum balloti]